MRFRHWLVLNEASQQETQALKLLGGDEKVLAQLKSISPEPKFLPVLALLHREQPDLAQLGKDWGEYKRLLDSKKMPLLSVQGDRIVTPPNNQPITYLQWTEKVHAMGGDAEMVRRRMDIDYSQWKPPIFKNEDLEVYETDGPGDCIRYGKGHSFCISQPGNTMWQSYRDTQTSTFYFVYDKSLPDTDPLRIVVVDMTNRGPILTDAKNTTGRVAEYGTDAEAYLDHLHKRGVPRDIFRNKEHTKEEKEETNALGRQNLSLVWFRALSPDQKSRYIGRGHRLSDEQFDYILDNGMDSLVKQYAEMGIKLNDHQMDRMLESKSRSTYLHFRIITDQNKNDIDLKEWERMSPEQKKAISPRSRARMAGATGDMDYVNSIKDKGSWATTWIHHPFGEHERIIDSSHTPDFLVAMESAKHGRLDVLKTIIDQGKKAISQRDDSATKLFRENLASVLDEAMKADQEEAVAVILGELGDDEKDQSERIFYRACREGKPKVFKMLAEKHWDSLGKDEKGHLFEIACGSGNSDTVKYLSGLIFSRPKWASYLMPLESLKRGIINASERNDHETVRHLVGAYDEIAPEADDPLLSPILAVSNALGRRADPSKPIQQDDTRTLKFLIDRLIALRHPLNSSILAGALYNSCKDFPKCNLRASAYLMLKGARDEGDGPGNIDRQVFKMLGVGEGESEESKKEALRKAAGES